MNTQLFRPDTDYWKYKLANYLHDPPDKALGIPGHEERSQELCDRLDLPRPDKNEYQRADQIASGMDRTCLPGYSADQNQNGAVDFLKHPMLTHPTGANPALSLELPANLDRKAVAVRIQEITANIWDTLTQGDRFRNNPAGAAAGCFHAVHHFLRERLTYENVGGLGGLWHRLPADTRIPDHSIWQHCALVSALTSCFHLSPLKQASLLVFSLTPVQDFIARARKLRDYWVGSVLLSWLTFEGIKAIVYQLGSDHVLYPSLIGQPLVNQMLFREFGYEPPEINQHPQREASGAASFPNKFLCLVPNGSEKDIAQTIEKAISQAWVGQGQATLAFVEKILKVKDSYLTGQFDRQLANFWECRWAACPLVGTAAADQFRALLPESVWEIPLKMQTEAEGIQVYKDFTKGEGGLYSISHALTQSMLAAGKTCRQDRRGPEKGIKCSLHGDLEILRQDWKEGEDRNPRPSQDPFWRNFKSSYNSKTDFKTSERLSAVGLVKRLMHRICRDIPDHSLKELFKEAERFPSTTEIALTAWLDEVEALGLHQEFAGDPDWRKKLAQHLHDQEPGSEDQDKNPEISELDKSEREISRTIITNMAKVGRQVRDEDRYYAILVMDGDHMGKLVNGVTLGSTWKSVIHPDLVRRLENPGFKKEFHAFWQDWLNRRRLLSPGVHAAISEALADFSLRTVPEIISRYIDSPQKGRLIYAGGDDVCAVLPVAAALNVAKEIAQLYNRSFLFFPPGGGLPQSLEGSWQPEPGRMAIHLGIGLGISISAAILIVHHKQPLAGAMRRAQVLLKNGAKEQGGRNALAVELAKRSGGPRSFVTRWQEMPMKELGLSEPLSLLEHFLGLSQSLGAVDEKEVSSTLLYRLEEYRPGFEALIHPRTGQPHNLVKLMQTLLVRSGAKPKDKAAVKRMAEQLTALIARQRPEQELPVIDTQPLAMTVFLSRCLKTRPQEARP